MFNLDDMRNTSAKWLTRITKFVLFILLFFISLVVCSVFFTILRSIFPHPIFILIRFVAIPVVSLALACFSYSLIFSLLWHAERKRAEREDFQRKHRPDGQPYPPSKRGLCDNCSRYHDTVYSLESGARLCPSCYHILLES